MKKWVIGFFAVTLCISLAMPVWAADQGESVWAKYNMKLYGRVKVDYKYLDGRSTSTSVAYNMVDKMTATDYNNDSTNFTAKDTRFGLIASHAEGEWAAMGRFEMDMFGSQVGNTTTPRFRLGYVNLANSDWGTSFRAGQDWNCIAQMNPSTIDFGILGHAGNLWERTVQFTIRQKLADNSVEMLVSAFRFASTSTASETRMPWVGARAAYTFEAFGGKHLVAVNGAYERDKSDTTKDDFDRWLVAAEFKFGLGPVLLKGEVWTGEAIDGAFTRTSDVATVDSGNETNEIAGWGGWVDATYKIDPDWSVTAGFGVDTPDKGDFKVNGVRAHMGNNAWIQNRNIFVNTWYTIFPGLKLGAEWMYVSTEREQGTADPNPGQEYTSSFNQIIASVFYNF